MLKAIIFDLDETLLDWGGRSLDWETYEWDHLGRVFDYVHAQVHPLSSRDHFYEDMQVAVMDAWADAKHSLRAPNLGDVLINTLTRQGVPRHLLDAKECLTAYAHEAIPGIQAFTDAPAVLEKLRAVGLRLGIVTNAFQPMFMRDVELEAVGLMPYFAEGVRLSAADVGFLKPHPQIFEEVLSGLGISAGEAVFVGDNLRADIGGAQGVGMKAVLSDRGQSLGYKVAPNGGETITPDGKITTLDNLFALLDEWYPGWGD